MCFLVLWAVVGFVVQPAVQGDAGEVEKNPLTVLEARAGAVLTQLASFHETKDTAAIEKAITETKRLGQDVLGWDDSSRALARHVVAALWLQVGGAVDLEADPTFNADDVPQMNLVPPGGKYDSGIAPESIKEPEIRKEYEKALALNAQKAEKYRYQVKLKKMRSSVPDAFGRFIALAYPESAEQRTKLTRLMANYQVPDTKPPKEGHVQ